MDLIYQPLDTALVQAWRKGAPDANGQPAERGAISDGVGVPCRHCLRDVPKGAPYLILAARPFPTLQPYAETGPIFLCEAACAPWSGAGVPPILQTSPDYLLKAYNAYHRILYGTGKVTPSADVDRYASTLLARADVAFVDVRSARNNCFQVRIQRADYRPRKGQPVTDGFEG